MSLKQKKCRNLVLLEVLLCIVKMVDRGIFSVLIYYYSRHVILLLSTMLEANAFLLRKGDLLYDKF